MGKRLSTVALYHDLHPEAPNRTLARIISEAEGGNINTWRVEIVRWRNKHGVNPGYNQATGKAKWAEGQEKKLAKVLLFDLETAPLLSYHWGKWSQNINDDNILADWSIICWSAKWLFEDKVISMKCTPSEMRARNDKRITKGLWKLFDEANVIIAHNLKKFDKKRAQTRFLKHGFFLPSHYQEIDTLVSARKQFAITSNRLDYIAQKFLNIEGKMETPKGLWLDACGDPFIKRKPSGDAIETMSKYCDQDTRVLEDVYLYLRPYITNYPNLALWEHQGEKICKACGNKEFTPIGDYTTIVNIYEGFRCKNCGSVHRARKPVEQSKVFLR